MTQWLAPEVMKLGWCIWEALEEIHSVSLPIERLSEKLRAGQTFCQAHDVLLYVNVAIQEMIVIIFSDLNSKKSCWTSVDQFSFGKYCVIEAQSRHTRTHTNMRLDDWMYPATVGQQMS